MLKKSGYYIVNLKGGQEYRVKADSYNQAVNIVIDTKNKDLRDVIDANPEYIER